MVTPNIQLGGIGPELALLVAALVLLVADAFVVDRPGSSWVAPVAATLGLIASIVLAIAVWGESELQLSNAIALDGFATFSKICLAVFGLLTVWVGRDYLARDGIEESEFYALLLLAVSGMMLMASAADLIVMFIALETFSIALYVLVGGHRRARDGHEAALKYFLLGSFSSAFFLLGIAFVYGAAGSTNLYGGTGAEGSPGILQFLTSNPGDAVGFMVLAMAFLIIGLGFKVAAVPFHMWTPDAYQGAPSPVTGFMAAGSKFAAFAAMLRLFDLALFPLRADWRPVLVGIAVATMVVGSLLAVVQEDVKRLLAYSSIAHAGFVLTGVIAVSDRGVSGSLFYLATYGLTVLGAFAVVSLLAGKDESRVRLTDYRGAFYDHPLLAGALTLFLLSLAGVPLTSGFVAKLVVFGPAIEAGYTWLVVVGAIASAVAAFFYLRVLVVMYMQESETTSHVPAGGLAIGVIAVTAVATLALGIYAGPLLEAVERATFFFAGG